MIVQDELLSRPALELAERVRRRELSSRELVSRCLDRIAAQNDALQAFVSVSAKSALRAADARDRDVRRKGPASLPPFCGLPMGVKDVNLVRGSFARMGSRAFSWLWSPVDDVTVRALRRAGFVILGKTATSELAAMPVVEPDLHPPTRNPWDPERTAGGSSGGAAAAVAGGLLPVAHGSDGGGSIRIPASFCGLVGHKASRGLLPNPYRYVDPLGMTTCGALTRTVEDAAAMLDALLGRLPGAPGSLLEASGRPPAPLRVGLVIASPLGATDPEVAEAVRRTARRLAVLGHHVEELVPLQGSLEEFLPIYQRLIANAPVLREGLLQPVTRWLRAEGRRHRPADIRRLCDGLIARVHQWFGDIDVLLTPTVPVPPPRVGAFRDLPPAESFGLASVLGAFTAIWNLTGHPATSVPAGLAAGLPVGAQLVGRTGQDATLLALARQLQQTN